MCTLDESVRRESFAEGYKQATAAASIKAEEKDKKSAVFMIEKGLSPTFIAQALGMPEKKVQIIRDSLEMAR